MKEYYNTNRETGDTLTASRIQARNQRLAILAYFRRYPAGLFAPHVIRDRVLPGTPLTSVRRAITNLADDGLLEKTRHMEIGTYGKQVHQWRLVPPEPEAPEAPEGMLF